MKKTLPVLTTILLAFLLVGIVNAVSVTVTTVPDSIIPGGSTVITVTADEAATGSVTVYTPSNTPYVAAIAIPSPGASDSVTFPDDFIGASSAEIGEYEVTIFLNGREFKATFYVSFTVHVVPEFAIVGTAGAGVAMLSGLGIHAIKKRKNK